MWVAFKRQGARGAIVAGPHSDGALMAACNAALHTRVVYVLTDRGRPVAIAAPDGAGGVDVWEERGYERIEELQRRAR